MRDFLGLGTRVDRYRSLFAPLICSTIVGCSADQVVERDENNARAGNGGSSRGGASPNGSAGASYTKDGTVAGANSGSTSVLPPTFGGSPGGATAGAPPSDLGGAAGSLLSSNLGGTAGMDGNNLGGALPNMAGAAGACNGLDGTWTARFTMETASRTGTNCWVSESGHEPAFRTEAPGDLGVTLTALDGKCAAQMYPEYGGVIETELSPTADGLEFVARSLTSLSWCHPMEWQLDRLNLVHGTPPTARMMANVVGFCDDMSFVSETAWSATLTPGLPSQSLRLMSEYPYGLVCGWATSPVAPLRVLPWHRVPTKTALPTQNITASGINPELLASWPLPLPYSAVQSQAEDYLWVVSADMAASAYLQIAHTHLAPAFENETLAELTLKGTSVSEQIDGTFTLRVQGKPCTDPIWAGGRLQVSGKSRVTFVVEAVDGYVDSSRNEPGGIRARVIDPGGATMPSPVWTKMTGTNARVGTIPLAGQSEVGVELAWDVNCTPMEVFMVKPDMRIHAIRAE